MNKMHFYCFLPSLSTDFTDFSVSLEPQTTQTDAKIIYDSCCFNLLFLRILRLLWLILVAHPGTRTWCHALPWWALCCSLSSRTAAAVNKNTLDYDVSSRWWSRTTARPCRARDGVGLLFIHFNGLYRLAVDIAVASLAQH